MLKDNLGFPIRTAWTRAAGPNNDVQPSVIKRAATSEQLQKVKLAMLLK